MHYIAAFVRSVSRLIVMMKYCSIVHDKKAKKVGIERTITIFINMHLAMTTILPRLSNVSKGDVDYGCWVNKCWGAAVRTSNITISFWNRLGKHSASFMYTK